MSGATLAPLTNADLGFVASCAIAFVAYRARALDAGGALAAVAVGTASVAGLGAAGAAVLLAFFVTSIALSRAGRARKRTLLVDVAKNGARDASQVFANGGIAAICALLAPRDPRFAVAFAGAFAAATADTWGTEIGTLARGTPRSIFTLRKVATGLSGGVSVPGTLAEIGGAVVVAAIAFAVGIGGTVAIAFAGVAGALVDSMLGATVQRLNRCPACERYTEREPHDCGANTVHVRGVRAIGNDAVNLAATFAGGAIAYALAPYFLSR